MVDRCRIVSVAGQLVLRNTVWSLLFLCVASSLCCAEDTFIALPESAGHISVVRGSEPYLDVHLAAWEKNWKFLGFRGDIAATGTTSRLVNRAATSQGGQLVVTIQMRQTGPAQLSLDVLTEASRDTELTYVCLSLEPVARAFDGGRALAQLADAKTTQVPLPFGRGVLGADVTRMTLTDATGNELQVGMEPACAVNLDGAARVVIAQDTLRAGAPRHMVLQLTFAEPIRYYADVQQVPGADTDDSWYEFHPDANYDAPSEIGMEDWLEKPAGKHGRITRRGAQLIYDDQPIKLWGVNVCYSACAPEKSLAEKRAQFYARYGINAVRLHKYADGPGWSGIQSADSFVEFDPDGLDRLDYQIAQFKKRGIYVKMSAHFGAQKLGPADAKYVPYLNEFGAFSARTKRVVTPHSAVQYAPELQRVQILQMQNLMRHKNPYTGLIYAADPAVAFVEIINEQSILFYTSMAPLKASPTLRRDVAKRFCQWLRDKYGSAQELIAHWGPRALDSFADETWVERGESLDKDNILPLGNPWYWDPEQLNGSQAFQRQRLLDTLQFLYELQTGFYARYVKAMRAVGYDGEIVSTAWQAGRALSHFCNLHSDALVGTVDRHNYFGGGTKTRINNATMLAVPGAGTLSTGLQQVADRPFMLSEWIHVRPNEWGVEGPAVIGAYGMGLQGWDVSFMFQNRDTGTFSERVDRDRWDVTAPNVMGVFPAVARQVLRGDVRESDVQAHLNVHVPSLLAGKIGFQDRVTQQYDVKTFTSDKVPAAALAVARCSVRFTDQFVPTPAFDMQPYLQNGRIVSTTGQLRWRPGKRKLDGAITIDTPGTQAFVGFAQEEVCRLQDVTITPQCRYAAIYVTAKDPHGTLADSNSLIVVAIARARNSHARIFQENRILDAGKPPIVMEPVKAEIEIRRTGRPTVYVLDHNGRKTDTTLPVRNGKFTIDGARDQTCYYLISFSRA